MTHAGHSALPSDTTDALSTNRAAPASGSREGRDDDGYGRNDATPFVLSFWNGDPAAFGLRPFDFTRAWGTWDEAHRAALLAWAQEPFWP